LRRPFLWLTVFLTIGITLIHKWEAKTGQNYVFRPPSLRLWMEEKDVEQVNVKISGVVEWIYETESGYAVLMDTDSNQYGRVRVYVKEDYATCELLPGDEVRVNGRAFLMKRAENPGEFDLRAYYDANEVYLGISAEGDGIGRIEKLSLRRNTYVALRTLTASVEKYAVPGDSGELMAIFANNRAGLDEETEESYSAVGLFFLFSSTGFFVSFLGIGLFELLRKMSGKPVLAAVVTFVVLCGYVIFCGSPVSGLRAMIVVLIRIGAFFVKRKFDLLTGAAVALFLLLLEHPTYLFLSSIQFYLAVLVGIGIIAPTILANFVRRPSIFTSLVYLFSIQICILPMQLLFNFTCSPYTLLLGGLVSGLRVILWACTWAGAVFGLFSPDLSEFAFGVAHGFLSIQEGVVEIGEKLPFSFLINGSPSAWRIGVYVLLIVLIFVYFRVRFLKMRYVDEWDEPEMHWKDYALIVVCLGVVYLFGIVFLRADSLGSSQAEIVALSVGQGDCTIVRSGTHTYLIDGGSSDNEKVGKNIIEEALFYYGVDELDAVFITHDDTDHRNGIQYLLESGRVEVKKIYISAAAGEDAFKWLLQYPERISLEQVFELEAGDTAGPFLVLWPNAEVQPYAKISGNDTSLVLEWNYGTFSALFAGDISSEVEKKLVISHPYTYLKVAHHGSRYSSSESFLHLVSPIIATVSYGRNNVYGHPSPYAVSRIEAVGTCLYKTGASGAINISIVGGKFTVSRYVE